MERDLLTTSDAALPQCSRTAQGHRNAQFKRTARPRVTSKVSGRIARDRRPS